MSQLKLSLHPTRAYDTGTVMRLMLNDASYGAHSQNISNTINAANGINSYFQMHSPSSKKKLNGPSKLPNLKM